MTDMGASLDKRYQHSCRSLKLYPLAMELKTQCLGNMRNEIGRTKIEEALSLGPSCVSEKLGV